MVDKIDLKIIIYIVKKELKESENHGKNQTNAVYFT